MEKVTFHLGGFKLSFKINYIAQTAAADLIILNILKDIESLENHQWLSSTSLSSSIKVPDDLLF